MAHTPSAVPARPQTPRWRLRLLGVLTAVATMVITLLPVQGASAAIDVYTTPGQHFVNGRDWQTTCSPYSSSINRCRTEIRTGGRWVFNNLTYLPAPRASWGSNPLANNTSWSDANGRRWMTECDTPRTGRDGCRSYIRTNGAWVFNNIVMFGTSSAPVAPPAGTQPTTTPPTTKPPTTTPPTTKPPTATPPTTQPPTTPPTTPATGRPNAGNTGVPSGTTLTRYTGPMTITVPNTVISGKTVTGTLRIQAPGVQILNSRINGSVDLRDPKNTSASFTITDSEVHIGDNLNTGLMRGNFRANRVEVTGGRRSMYCQFNCVIENSWVHAQGGDPGGDAHFSGIRMEQNTTLRNNTITCEAQRGSGTGCSAGLTGYGDFAPIQNNLIEGNIFTGGGGGGSTICAYGGSSGDNGKKPYGHQARDIRFINNVFVRGASGKCGNLGAIKSFDTTRPGNQWAGNTWDNGRTIGPNG